MHWRYFRVYMRSVFISTLYTNAACLLIQTTSVSRILPCVSRLSAYGPLTRYVKMRVAHAPGMPGTFSPSPRGSDPDMHHGTCVTHVPWCMSGSLTGDFLWNRWRGKRSRHSRRMRNPQFYLSGKRPIADGVFWLCRIRCGPHMTEGTWRLGNPMECCKLNASNILHLDWSAG